MTHFKDLGLAEPILKAVAKTGYTSPTPIQKRVIPNVINRKDVIGIAQTGTGKTASFVLPILNGICRDKRRPQAKTAKALILTPTRELAIQIADCIKTYNRFTDASVAVVVGGVKPGPQIKALARGVDILVATPGRLLDHMGSGAIRLDKSFQVVADEADQMMDMGFLPSIRKIMAALPTKRQTILMSATMPSEIRRLSKDFMRSPEEISVAPAAKPIERIEQSVMHVEKPKKKKALVTILGDDAFKKVVVFTRTKRGANVVASTLVEAGIEALAIHGNKSQAQRQKSLASFRAGDTRVLVATDIAARGIDIDDVTHVINFELPNVPESYVHRIGRTARAGRAGTAISLCDPSEIDLLKDIEKLTGRRLMPASLLALEGMDQQADQTTQSRKPGQSRKPRKSKKAKSQQHTENKRRPRRSKPKAENTIETSRARKSGGKRKRGKPAPARSADGLMRMLGEGKSAAA